MLDIFVLAIRACLSRSLLQGQEYIHFSHKKGCVFCTSGKVETKKHFILECEAFKDSRDNYINILTSSSWNDLFSQGIVDKLGEPIIKLNRKMVELLKSVCETICPIGYC
jgi:hypothetical protein